MDINWQWATLQDLTAAQMHAILAIRQRVFVVEQNCAYQDADELDLDAWHLTGHRPDGRLAAYLRLIAPGARFPEASIGRLLTVKALRGRKIAGQALEQALRKCEVIYPRQAIRIAAQTYLVDFYRRFGFRAVGSPYKEDGIEHIDMIRSAAAMDLI